MTGSEVIIIAVGDICLGDHYFSMGHGVGSVSKKIGLESIFEEVRHIFQNGHIVFGNLECVLSNSTQRISIVEKNVFRGIPQFTKDLRKIGFNILNIANNHILQHEIDAFWETISALENAGITPLGLAGSGQFSSIPVIKRINGLMIGFLGYSLVPEKYCPKQKLYAQGPLDAIFSDVGKLSKETDITIVSLHFGDEGVQIPSPFAIFCARQIIKQGAKVVLGHHPHIFQPVEKYKHGLIFYSLGNFIFDLFWYPPLVHSAIVKISIGLSSKELNYSIYPIELTHDYRTVLLNQKDSCQFKNELEQSATKVLCEDFELYSLFYKKELDKMEKILQRKKIIYFLSNFWKGNSFLKKKFLINKFMSCLRNNLEI